VNLKEDFQALKDGKIPYNKEWARMIDPADALTQIIQEGHEARACLLAGNGSGMV